MGQLNSLFVKRDKLSDQVATKIQEFILQGDLKPGDQLPAERILGEQLGVSRTVVREAFRLLQERGLVRVVTGSGTYVTLADSGNISQSIGVLLSRQPADFQDLIEIRRFMEVEIATMAASRVSENDIERMEETIVLMEKAIPDIYTDPDQLEQFIQADMAFHDALADATRNSLFPIFLSSIVDLLRDFRRQASSTPGAPEAALQYHQTLLNHIRLRDAEGARQVMKEHMAHAEQVVAQALPNQNTPNSRIGIHPKK